MTGFGLKSVGDIERAISHVEDHVDDLAVAETVQAAAPRFARR
ncbi:hypothetical protein I601_4113 [Nocardioides dokdonensis FR1436]|uniref:Uncharacterized protein n=1 Tax=Nocardioides dokdonensis FR1436 TaxID=1300347 RepID=A0A1A9GQF2_9ACTN|nr:hypothetical protein [Nocardioides dokdonensis]ANH40508.1 hypothetical protein I601_4113 [Nocardioides dokdonensis FR1436]